MSETVHCRPAASRLQVQLYLIRPKERRGCRRRAGAFRAFLEPNSSTPATVAPAATTLPRSSFLKRNSLRNRSLHSMPRGEQEMSHETLLVTERVPPAVHQRC